MARVLIVDDEPTILLVLEALLQSAGHEVVTAEGAEKAVEVLTTTGFDLLISDVRMYPMDGVQLLKFARSRFPNLPAIMVTAFDLPDAKQTSAELGAFAYLRKPFNNSSLLAAVEQAISQMKNSKGNPGTDPGKKTE